MANRRTSDGDSNQKSEYYRIYSIWSGMKNRCKSKTSNDYGNYGARGISVCDEWTSSYKSFKEWSLQNKYHKNRTLDRIKTDGNYEPENCRWVSHRVQQNNKRSNVLVKDLDGEHRTLAQLARKYNINSATVKTRYNKHGKDIGKLIAPINNSCNNRTGVYVKFKDETVSIVTLAKRLKINRKTLLRKYNEAEQDIDEALLFWKDKLGWGD